VVNSHPLYQLSYRGTQLKYLFFAALNQRHVTGDFNSTQENARQVKVEKRVALVLKNRYQSIHFCFHRVFRFTVGA